MEVILLIFKFLSPKAQASPAFYSWLEIPMGNAYRRKWPAVGTLDYSFSLSFLEEVVFVREFQLFEQVYKISYRYAMYFVHMHHSFQTSNSSQTLTSLSPLHFFFFSLFNNQISKLILHLNMRPFTRTWPVYL